MAGKRWTAKEIHMLEKMARAGIDRKIMKEVLVSRSMYAIDCKLTLLGLTNNEEQMEVNEELFNKLIGQELCEE